MRGATWALAVSLLVALVVAGWLFRDNRSLRADLEAVRSTALAGADTRLLIGDGDSRADGLDGDGKKRGADTVQGLLRGLSRFTGSRDRPALEAVKKETRQERRLRRQQRIRQYLGRRPGETDAEYKERVVPLVEMGLARPRENVTEAWKKAIEAGEVTQEQLEQLDGIFNDTYDELLDMANKSIAAGDLSPYERNWSGILEFTGGLGVVLASTEGRIGEILSPDQLSAISGTGFEWGEYLGAKAPWEQLDPPPPSDSDNDG